MQLKLFEKDGVKKDKFISTLMVTNNSSRVKYDVKNVVKWNQILIAVIKCRGGCFEVICGTLIN